MRSFWLTVALCLPATFFVFANDAHGGDESQPAVFDALEYRCIGPARGGRATAGAGVVGDPLTYYMGATGGGVWKTDNAGLSWRNVTDDFVGTGSVGAVAVAESDPNVVYVGMGESCPRGNFSHGDGMYKSTDAGKTWSHIGLDDSRQVGEIEVHPDDPDLVYVAVLGHVYGSNEQRGVFRSTDGGATWEKILYVDEHTGAVDIEMDPTNPRVLYAGFWQVRRTPWSLESGGPGSGIWKSTDAGDTWEPLTEGLPEGVMGRVGLAVSPADPNRVYACVEAKDGGVFRSDDAGETWRRVNSDNKLRQRAWYYTHIYADPKNVDTVYVLNVGFWKSTDGGKHFDKRIRVPHGDNHELWINPDNPRNMLNTNDGGANVTFDGGESWTEQDMQPTAQFYHVTVDNQFPYRVYGAQQDNSTISISSRNRLGDWRNDWYAVGGGESGYIAVHPDDPDIVYAGSYGGYLTRYDHETDQTRNIMVWPENPMGHGAAGLKYRFQWTFPIVVSPHDSDTLYTAANVLFKSTNEGQSWEQISPDLTTNDKSRQGPSGGPITKDNTSVEYYCTIFSVAESPHEQGVIWAGSDDGLVHLTRDGGETWKNVTPAGLGEWSLISLIEPSPHDPATCYLAVNRYKLDDFTPYIFVTNDYGQTWRKITHGIDEHAFVRAVREDPARRGLLYAGTETGVWVSMDDGEHWRPLQLNLPHTPITDLVVHEDDLVVATQGRSFWILDDLTPLHQWRDEVADAEAHLFEPRETHRISGADVQVHFLLSEDAAASDAIRLEFLDSEGELIKTFNRKEKESSTEKVAETNEEESAGEAEAAQEPAPDEDEEAEEEQAESEDDDDKDDEETFEVAPGMNRFEWDMRYPDAEEIPGAVLWAGDGRGPAAAPGEYTVRLVVGETTIEQAFQIIPDPRLDTPQEAYDEQFEFLWSVRNAVDEAHTAVNRIRTIRGQVEALLDRTADHKSHDVIEEAAEALLAKLKPIEEAILQTRSKSPQDPLNYPIRLSDKIAGLTRVVARGDDRPTDQAWAVYNELRAKLDAELARLDVVLEDDVPAFNFLVLMQKVPAIIVGEQQTIEAPDDSDGDDG